MKRVYAVLNNRIKEFTSHEVYSGQASDKANYPYAVLKLSAVDNTEKDRDDYMLTVSCWDKNEQPSHSRAVGLAEDVRKALLNYRYLDEHQLIIVGRPAVGNIPDQDTQIKRYDVTALIKMYRRV